MYELVMYDNGLIKNGIDGSKRRWKDATQWLTDHEEQLHDFLMAFYEEEESSIISDLLYYDCIKADDLHTWLKFGKGNLRRSFGDLPNLVNKFYESNVELFNIDLTDDFSRFR